MKHAKLWCPDCAKEDIPVYIWERPGPDRGKVVAAFDHGTAASVSGRAFSEKEQRWYYHVQKDGKEGFVPHTLIRVAKDDG